jgi:hypothetical protein
MVKNYLRTGTPFAYDVDDAQDDWLDKEFDHHPQSQISDNLYDFEDE